MKYIVFKDSENAPEDLFIFPDVTEHSAMRRTLDPSGRKILVSAGSVSNYRDTFKMHNGEMVTFDQVSLGGESFTLKVKSRPKDVDLFRRLTGSY
jgi:hypothetical protein